jgi:hypothetical protein
MKNTQPSIVNGKGFDLINRRILSARINFITLLSTVFLLSSIAAFGQDENDPKSGVIISTEFHVTAPLREIFAKHPVNENRINRKHEAERDNRIPQHFEFSAADGPQYGNDSTTQQRQMGTVQNRAPITNWPGQNPGSFRPFDPCGAAGPNDYVQITNGTIFKVYNKVSGAVTLTAALSSLWTPNTPDDGDPIILYDKSADRWFLSQFGSSGNKIYIAISVTNDPAGAYYTYTFTSPEFPDYLKFSCWQDGYYMTSNQTQKVFCFERSAMIAGSPSARAIYTSFTPPQGNGFFVPLTADASDGVLPPAGAPCPIFSYSDNGWGTGYIDALNIYQMTVNWSTITPSATITLNSNIPTAAFDGTYDSNWDDISQPGTSQKLDGIGGVCMFRAQWKMFGGYNTVLLNWGVKINTTQRSIKWCELRQDQSSGSWSIYQEGIYVPDAATRWMGGIGIDNNGSIALCYMKSDATSIYPGLYYTGRRACDPLGTLPITEELAITGSGSQTTNNRDGDYADLVLDPDGITFWYTSEYMGGSSGGSSARTQIFSFQLPNCANIASVSVLQTSGNVICPGDTVEFTATPFNGGTPTYQWQVNGVNVGSNSPTYSSDTLTSGDHVTCIMTSSLGTVTGNPATSNAVTINVNPVVTPAVTIALSTGSNPSCAGSPVIFTASPVNGGLSPGYLWLVDGLPADSNGSTFTTSSLTDGQVVTCQLNSNASCASIQTVISDSILMNVNPVVVPTATIAQTGGSNPYCAGDTIEFTATILNGAGQNYQWKLDGINVGTNSQTYTETGITNGQVISCEITATSACSSFHLDTVGNGTTTNSLSSNSGVAYPTLYGNGRQQYLVHASELTALGFTAGNITSIGFKLAGTVGDPVTLNGYTIKIGATNATVTTTTFLTPAFTTVFGPVNYTPVINSVNIHSFTTPFVWDGVSNILIDICFSNQVTGTIPYQNYRTTTSFNSCTYYQADGAAGAGACNVATTTHIGTRRPNMVITIGANIPMINSNSITMNVYPAITTPVITQGGGDTLYTANTYTSYQWYVDNSPLLNTNSYYIIAPHDGNYTVEVTDNNGCVGTGQLSNVIAAVTESITDNRNFNVRYNEGIFNLSVNSANGGNTTVEVHDEIGKLIFSKNILLVKGKNNFDLTHVTVSDGVYFIRLSDAYQNMTKKIFVENGK